ncbi:PREDICTED: ZEAMMB73_Zm00001d030666 [Prunus dulcis]|uniref:PREDICTED: ZEAMMB73_Zm00001d030666 n=1 Tax=Prunus dulcis TaxID=3755 RepID=A0A5E4EBZ4_PRUDU|nr:zinc finger C3H1 domain-containing protein isoform X1 [Prunus dulcis]VVA12429.1 PREDICTED: ZEAMMB73_Zm00001d030666 [Prunus dulcis]
MEDEAMQTAPEPPNKSPNSELSPHPAKIREEGELSSDDDDENTICSVPHSTASSVPTSGAMLVPPMNKFTQGTQEGKALSGNVLASSADIRSQTSIQPTSQKINDKNRIPLKSATPGWRAPLGANDDLVIRFSDDDSDSGEKEHRIEKARETKSHVTGVVANGKPPTSSFARSNILRQTARNVDKVMPKKMSMNRTFISSMTGIRGVDSRDSGPSSVNQGSRVRNFNSMNKNVVSRERGYDQGVGLNNSKLQDLRQQIALRESELKLKSAQRTKESITHEASKSSARYSDVIEGEPKEPDKKRMKVGGSFSTQLSALGPQDIPVAKSTLSSKLPAVENNNPLEIVKIDHGQKGILIGPTESSIEKSKSQNDKHVAGILEKIPSGVKYGAGIDTKCIQSSGGSKMVDLYDTLNQGASQEIMTCNNLPKNLNTVELNQTNGDGGHLKPGSFLKKSTSGKNRLRSADHQEVIASDKKLDPSYNICQASLNNASLWNCFGNANVTANGDIHSLVEMEENLDKDLEEAQEHRRRCEIEEKKALKAYRKAQRDLLQANVRCTDLYRQRELYSANLRSFIMDNSSLIWSSRQNEQAGIGLDLANNVSENVDLIPTSGHQMHPEDDGCNPAACDSNIQCVNNARIHTSYKHLSEQNMGIEPCSEPDSSTSEPVPLLGNNGADGICSPSNELNNSADEDEDEARFSFENESVQPNVLCHKNTDFGNKQKEMDKESNRKMSIDSPQDPVLLERMLRSKLFATLGTKTLSKNSSSCNNTEEHGAENDVRSEKPQEIKGSFPFSEAERNHEGTDGQEKSSSEAPLEIQREHSVENISVNCHSNSYSEDRLYLSGNILRSTFGYMKVICPKYFIEHEAISQQSPTCINSEKVQFSNVMVEPLKETRVKLARREVGTYSTSPAIDPFWPLCMYELRGKCNNDECPWQHVKDYCNTNMHQHQHDNSGSADCQVGLTLHKKKCDDSAKVPWYNNAMTSPTYLVGLGIMKAELHSYEPVLARRNGQWWKKCFSLFLVLSNLFRKDVPEDVPFLHGNDGHMEFPVSWNRQSSYFQSSNSGVSQLTQALADNDQYLEMALLIFSQEANELEGLRKALPVLSRALEADPTSIILWIFYLLIYYSNMKSVGKDDMFSCAVKYNDRSYELWLMCINSRMQLDDRLVTYDVALSALCRHATASDIDGTYASACTLDLCLQMMDCLCMSGNIEKAIQKTFGLFPTATNFDEPNSLSLSDILTCLTFYDKCILGVCCVYLVIYRKLPDAVVQQFECQKELFEIEWPSIQLMDNEKQRATMLMETVVDSVDSYVKIESLEKSEFNIRVAHFFALNHLRCMAALGSLERCGHLLDKYLTLYPSCVELVLISARTHKHDLGDSHFERFEEALSHWPKEVPGVQCIWNQYVEYALQNGRYDFSKEVMDRWFRSVWKVHYLQIGTLDEMNCDNSDRSQGLASNSIQQTLSSNPKQMDIMFGYLNLSLHNLLQNDHSEARLALDRALNAAVPEYFKHCVREHALFMLTDESLLKENGSISGIQKILEQYLGDAPAFPTSEPLSRKFVNNIKKPRVRQLVSNVFSPLSSDFSVVNSVLEVWYGPSLLPEKFSEQKNLVDFVEAILDITPSNYQLAISVCKMLSSGSNASDVTSLSALFWASSNLVSAIFHAVPIPPEYVWVEAAEVLGNIASVEAISERFYKRALSVYPFSVKLWKSYSILSMMTTGNTNTVVEAAKEKGIELG